MTVKKRLNDTKYVLQESAKSRPFVVHVDQMHHFYSDLSKESQDPQHISSMLDNLPEPTGTNSGHS